MLKAIVADNRPAPVAAPSSNVTVVGSGRVQDFDVGPKYRPYVPPKEDDNATTERSGWRDQIPLRPPEGVDLCDRLVDAQDAIDRAERLRKLAETAAIRKAEAEIKAQAAKPEGKGQN
jgi:hypothetical protein